MSTSPRGPSANASDLLRVQIPTIPGGCQPPSSTSGCSPSVCSVASSLAGGGSALLLASAFGASSTSLGLSPAGSNNKVPTLAGRPKEECFSLEGYLSMKCLTNALASLLQSRKRLYFGLEEMDNSLVYYRSKTDFDARKDCLGHIAMGGAFCSLVEGNHRAFMLHTSNGKKYQLESDNERAADCWLNALQQRRENGRRGTTAEVGEGEAVAAPRMSMNGHRRHRSRSDSFGHSDSEADLVAGLQRHRARTLMHRHKRFLPPLRLDIINGSPPIVGTGGINASSSTPPTPLSMPAPHQYNNNNNFSYFEDAAAGRRVPHTPLRKKSSIVAKTTANQMEQEEKQSQNRGEGADDRAGGIFCVCGSAETTTTQWVVDSWLRDQQRRRRGEEEGETTGQKNRESTLSTVSSGAQGDTLAPQNGHGEQQQGQLAPEPESPISPLTCSVVDHPADSPTTPLTVSSSHSGDDGGTDQQDTAELAMLRELSNRQKERIQKLSLELERTKKLLAAGVDGASIEQSFAAQNRFLNAELLRVNERRLELDRKIEGHKRQFAKLEAEMEEFKKEYVHLLQSCVRIPLRENSACDVVQVKLFGGDEHEKRVKKLLAVARDTNPSLPTFESVIRSGSFHVDEYGFRHSFDETPLAVHFIATQLHQHYQSQSADYVQLKAKWRSLLDAQPADRIERSREVRLLCRQGIPRSLRSRVWRLLIDHQVADLKAKHGPYYFRELCSSQGTPAEKHYSTAHQKQVNLDLLRTMPGNVHFMSASCKGVTYLQSVLRAYCLHNPSIGYCQGMNFLVATALLFMGPEDAFWFLVAVTERFFDSSYFDQSLTGAQADQEVLKEIVEQKFPRLAQHLEECEIDLTTVTLNFFIALFFDAVPFQTMLRLWDCFLYEGPKVLFRFTIALLGHHEEQLLAHSDTISVIKVLKAAVKLTLDVDGLIKFAFEELDPFPSKTYLRQRQSLYLRVLQEQLHKRHQLRRLLNVTNASAQSDQLCDLPIEVIVFSEFVPGRGYVCAGNQKRGKLSMIQLDEEMAKLNTLELEFDCRPISMVIFQREMAFLSLLSGYIVAVHLRESGEAEILWELKLNDVALKLLHCSQRLYSCLANGTLAVLENAFERMPSALDLYHIPIAAAPITDALLDEDHLYLAVACKILVLNRNTLSTVASVYVASAAAGSQVPMFEKIRTLAPSPHGIWLLTAHSSLLQLWRDGQCEMLFDVRYDHSHRKPSFDELDDQMEQVEVCSILFHSDELWVGTVDGYLMLYRVLTDNSPGVLSYGGSLRPLGGRFQPGKRLSPAHGLAQPVPANKEQTYYIPTQSEALREERNSSAELETDLRMGADGIGGRRISVKIDQQSRKYSVNVSALRQLTMSADSGHMETSPDEGTSASMPSSRIPSNSFPPETAPPSRRMPSSHQSVDSALSSVFFGSNSTAAGRRRVFSFHDNKHSASLLEVGDHDDFYETYSEDGRLAEEEQREGMEEENSRRQKEQRRRFPSRLIRIHSWRKLSSSMSASPGVDPLGRHPQGRRISSVDIPSPSAKTEESGIDQFGEAETTGAVRIRRKDLNFDAPLLLAVKEGDDFTRSLGTSPPSRKPSNCELALAAVGCLDSAGPINCEVETTEINSSLGMALQMKLKVADKPLRCIALGHFHGEEVVITGAGEYGDEEALLRWRRDPNSKLWINDPLVDMGVPGRKRTMFAAASKSPGAK